MIIPAIDLRGGRCVRLVEGALESERVFADDPVEQARLFERGGAARIHVVDLDGAFAGEPRHAAVIAAIARAVSVPIEVGGGLRSVSSIAAVLEAGAQFAIAGTMAVRDPEAFAQACARWPGRVIAGIDARDGIVRTDGWALGGHSNVVTVASHVASVGAAAIIYTDIARDGREVGIDLEGTIALADAVAIPVIASGGVGSLDDLRKLRGTKIAGVIVGRALYEQRFTLEEAIAACRTNV